MSEDVVYSEVVFTKRNKVIGTDPDLGQLGDSSQASQKSKPFGDRVRLSLMALCIFVTAGLIGLSLQYSYSVKKLKGLQQLHSALNDNFTAFSVVLQDMLERQQNLSKVLNASACPKDWEYHRGKCYFFSTNMLDWAQSRDSCISEGGHLVIINNRDEQDFLTNIAKTKNRPLWIGLTDEKKENQWLWVDNTEPHTDRRFWTLNEPDNWKGKNNESPNGEDCVVIRPDHGLLNWSDAFCSRSFRSICETRSAIQT